MRLALLALTCLPLAASTFAQTPKDAAHRLAQDAVIVDTHIDAPGILTEKWADLGNEAADREFDCVKAPA